MHVNLVYTDCIRCEGLGKMHSDSIEYRCNCEVDSIYSRECEAIIDCPQCEGLGHE